MRALPLLAIFVGCGGDSYMIVTVSARASVPQAATLEITQTNAGTSLTSKLALDSHQFPVTFSVSAPGRSGELDFQIDAKDSNDLLVGTGTGTTTVGAADATVQLDPADFVVNTTTPDDQFLTTDFETVGFQIASTADNDWTVIFRSACTDACDVYARRFDINGVPVKTAAAGTQQLTLTTTTTQSGAFPAIAGAMTTTLGVWDFTDTVGMGTGVGCRAMDAMGNPNAGQLTLSTDAADTATIAPLSNGNFAVSWQIYLPNDAIHTIIAKPDCTALNAAPVPVSTIVGTTEGPHRSSVAGNGNAVMYSWITDGAVHVRPGTLAAAFTVAEKALVMPATGSTIEAARVIALGQGFGVLVRQASMSATSAGSIQLYRTDATGTLLSGPPTLVTDKSGSDFSNGDQGFGVATRADGATMVVWHQCDDGSPGACDGHLDVYGRVLRPTGAPVGDPFQLATATIGDQVNPSVVGLGTGMDGAFAAAWNDASKTAPDDQGTSVRARLLYPPYDDAASIQGAACGASLPACNTGLGCAMGTDNTARCYQTCTPPTCPNGGTCMPTTDGTGNACVF